MKYTVNFDDYDLDYEIQYIEFMLNLLDPYIVFELSKDNDDNHSSITIYRIGLDKDNENVRIPITDKDYIFFIQKTFPIIIQNEIDKLTENENEGRLKKNVFIANSKHGKINNTFLLPSYYEYNEITPEVKKKCIGYHSLFKGMNSYQLQNLEYYYQINRKHLPSTIPYQSLFKDDMLDIKEKLKYLDIIKKIMKTKNKSIKDVIRFLKNLIYYL